MYFRLRKGLALPVSLVAILLICLSFLASPGATAAQVDEATPIDTGQPVENDGESPDLNSLSEDGDIGISGIGSVAFDDGNVGYTIAPEGSVTIYVTFFLTGTTPPTNYSITFPATYATLGFSLAGPTVTKTGGVVTCSGQIGEGKISGVMESSGSSGFCVVNFTFTATTAAAPTSFNLAAFFPDGTQLDSSSLTVATPAPTASFTGQPYSGKPGTTISAGVIFSFSATGSYDHTLVAPDGWTLTNVINTDSTGTTTCLPGDHAAFLVSIAPASCTFTFQIAIPPDADSDNLNYAITASGGAPFVQLASADITVTDTRIDASFDESGYSAYPGQSATAELTIALDGAAASETVTITNPDPSKLTFDNPAFGPTTDVICGNASIDDSSGNLTFDISSTAPGNCVITFTTTPSVDAAPGLLASTITASRAGTAFETNPSASFTVLALPAASFSNTPFTGAAGTSISGIVTFTDPDFYMGFVTLTLPTGWVFGSEYSGPCMTIAPAANSATGSVHLDHNGAPPDRQCVQPFSVLVPVDATPGDYALTAVSALSPANIGSATITVTATSGTAEFELDTYTAQPGDSTSATLTLTYDGAFTPGTFTITNPDPDVLTYYNYGSTTTGGVTCPAASIDDATGNYTGSIDATFAGTCTITFSIDVASDASPGPIDGLNASATLVTTSATAGFTVAPLPAVSFDQLAYSALPGDAATVVVTIVYGPGSFEGDFGIVNPAPDVLTFEDLVLVEPPGALDTSTVEIDPVSGNISGHLNHGSGVGWSFQFNVTVADDATPGGAGSILGNVPIGIAAPDPASFIVLDPHLPTGVFDFAPYAAQPWAATDGSLAINFGGDNPGGTFIITNPDASVLTFSNLSAFPAGDTTCDNVIIDASGNITGETSATGAGSCVIYFTITVASDTAIGPAGSLTATLPGGNLVDPAPFTVLPFDVVIGPINLTLNLNANSSISGDLKEYVSGGLPPYTFTLVSGPTQGDLIFNDDGTFTYTPNPDASGTDQFTFTVTDSEGVTLTSAAAATGTVTINIIQADSTATATPTATAPATPSATTTPTQTGPSPTATEKPVIPGRTPTATAISGDGTNGGNSGGNVTQLPSTGAVHSSDGTSGTMLFLLLVLGLILLGAANVITRRRSR